MRRFGAMCALVISWASAAQSQEPSPHVVELYELADSLFRADRYEEAASILEEAVRLEPHSILAYNLARTYERLNRRQDAATAYEQYLELEPTAPDAAEVRAIVLTLRDVPADVDARTAQNDPNEEDGQDSAPRPSTNSNGVDGPQKPDGDSAPVLGPVLLMGAGALASIATGVTWAAALRAREEYDSPQTTLDVARNAQASAERRQRATRGLLGVSAALGVAGAVWLVVRLARGPRLPAGGVSASGTGIAIQF